MPLSLSVSRVTVCVLCLPLAFSYVITPEPCPEGVHAGGHRAAHSEGWGGVLVHKQGVHKQRVCFFRYQRVLPAEEDNVKGVDLEEKGTTNSSFDSVDQAVE